MALCACFLALVAFEAHRIWFKTGNSFVLQSEVFRVRQFQSVTFFTCVITVTACAYFCSFLCYLCVRFTIILWVRHFQAVAIATFTLRMAFCARVWLALPFLTVLCFEVLWMGHGESVARIAPILRMTSDAHSASL